MPSPRAVQLMLPAIEKMAASPKAEQGIEKIMKMSQMVEPAAAGPSPWRQFIERLRGTQLPEGFTAQPHRIEGGFPKTLSFEMRKPGTASWGGSVATTKSNPFELYVEALQGGGSRRQGIGDLEQGLSHYTMDISSPAQRELPLRGMKLGQTERARRPLRTREDRYPAGDEGLEQLPPGKLADKQQAIDALLRTARQSGFKNLAFSAEPGERPRLYEKLVGYKAKEEGAEDIHSLLSRMTGRGPEPPIAMQRAADVPAYGSPRTQWARGLTEQTPLSESMLENALMLSADEAVDFGLAVKSPSGYRLTGEGVNDVRRALLEMGEEI